MGVPTVWSPGALSQLREAFNSTDIPRQAQTVEFLSEPEASALTLLNPQRDGVLLNVGTIHAAHVTFSHSGLLVNKHGALVRRRRHRLQLWRRFGGKSRGCPVP